MTRSSRTAGILSLVTPPIHPQAKKRLDGEGPRIWAPPLPRTPEEGSAEGALACKPFCLSPCFPPCSFCPFISSSPLLSSLSLCLSLTTVLSSYPGLLLPHPPLCLSESQTLSASLLLLFFLCLALTTASSHLLRAIALFSASSPH